jgi:hypothetical protein
MHLPVVVFVPTTPEGGNKQSAENLNNINAVPTVPTVPTSREN